MGFLIYGIILFLGLGLFSANQFLLSKDDNMQTKKLPENYDYLAPDGSEIRLLPEMKGGGMAHCVLPVGKTTKAVKHKTVEEIWFILEGYGEIWRKNENEEEVTSLEPGISISIPQGTLFQFRNNGNIPLKILISTMPPWPGKDEAIPVKGKW